MLSTSTSNRRRSKKPKSVSKPKQECEVTQPTRNWLEIPSDIMANILQRVGAIDVLENAQKVCTVWREICKDPAMWKVIHMDQFPDTTDRVATYKKMCKHAVDRSQGKLVDITIAGFGDKELLKYVTDRSSQLRRLEIIFSIDGFQGVAFENLSLLEELSLDTVSKEVTEVVGRCCPLLKTLKLNKLVNVPQYDDYYWDDDYADFDFVGIENEIVLGIGKNIPQLTRLELIRNGMDNIGLEAILDGCGQLESLDLRGCTNLDLEDELGKRCSRQIKDLKLPHDSVEGYHEFMKRSNYHVPIDSSYESNACCSLDYYEYAMDTLAMIDDDLAAAFANGDY